MSLLTDKERATIKHAMQTLKTEEQPYTYDRDWGQVYTAEFVNEIFEYCGLQLDKNDTEFFGVDEKLNITKTTIFNFGERYLKVPNSNNEKFLKYALLCLLWGYASQNYGKFRIKKMISQNDAINKLAHNTSVILELISNKDLKATYKQWQGTNRISGLGEAFFTKIIFFVSKHCEPCCILSIKDKFTSEAAALLFNMPDLTKRSLRSFRRYIEAMQYAAQVSGQSIESIEQFLFTARPSKK